MRAITWRRATVVLALMVLAAASGGCGVPDTFSRVQLAQSDRAAVAAALAVDAPFAVDGATQEVHNRWPTVIRVTHVAVPDGGLARWKLQLTGGVVHMILYQSLSVEVIYEGPLAEPIEDGLRVPKPEQDSEFVDALVRFVRERVTASLTDKWTDPALVAEDRYRSRMLGLFETTLQDLRGRASLTRERFGADLSAGSSSLHLRYLGEGLYRLEVRGSATLGPSPVL